MPELDPQDIELRTDEVQEILSDIPGWINRWGGFIILSVLLLLLVGTWIIRYPDIIVSQATIVTENPPVHLVARSSGKIKLLAKNKEEVEKDRYLAVIENPAQTEDVEKLRLVLDTVQTNVMEQYELLLSLEDLKLGELQSDFSVLVQAAENYDFFVHDDYYQNSINGINRQFGQYKALNEKLGSQKEILDQELKIAESKFRSNQELYRSGVISKQDLAQSEAIYLQKKYAFENAEINKVNNGIQLQENNKTVLDFQQRFEEKEIQLTVGLQESLKKMLSALAGWEQRYVIKAPIDGQVALFKFYSDNQYVSSGDEILTVIPETGNIRALVYAPVYGAGKIKPGQQVNLKIDSYPFKEFGMVSGKVQSIAKASRNNTYVVQVVLTQGLETSYHKKLEFKQEMSATAEIITDNLRIIERAFNQVRSLVSNHS